MIHFYLVVINIFKLYRKYLTNMKPQHFHNTIDATGQALIKYESEAKTQEQKILAFFQRYPNSSMTPDQVHSLAFSPNVPLTSIRRGISNLTKAGLLVKTEIQKQGKYGKPNYTWKLK